MFLYHKLNDDDDDDDDGDGDDDKYGRDRQFHHFAETIRLW